MADRLIGAYFAYVRHPFVGTTAVDVARRLASERDLLLIPGSYFGPDQEEYPRACFGNLSSEILADGPLRLNL
jgi:aspartate/methionine/tyrosine aminotransferase